MVLSSGSALASPAWISSPAPSRRPIISRSLVSTCRFVASRSHLGSVSAHDSCPSWARKNGADYRTGQRAPLSAVSLRRPGGGSAMLDDVRKNVFGLVEAGMAAVSGALTPARAREMARQVAAGEGSRQANRVAQELLEWSQRSREWISEAVDREVKRQLGAIGIATKDHLVALRKRVRELERAARTTKSGARKSSSGSKSPKRPSASSGDARKASATAKPASRADATEATGLGDPSSSVP